MIKDEKPKVWEVISNGLRLRSKAHIGDNVIRQLKAGEELEVYSIINFDSKWRAVRTLTDKLTGYVHSDYIRPSLKRKVENLEQKVNKLEKRLAKLEKDEVQPVPKPSDKITRQLSPGFVAANLSIVKPNDNINYQLRVGFTSHNGNFEYKNLGTVFHVEEYYAKKVLLGWNDPYVNKSLGADRHAFAYISDSNGNMIRPLNKDINVKFWYPGHPNGDRGSWKLLDKKSGSENFPMQNKYNPDRGEQGPYMIVLVDSNGNHISEEIRGMGLPYGWHVSFFLAFQEIT